VTGEDAHLEMDFEDRVAGTVTDDDEEYVPGIYEGLHDDCPVDVPHEHVVDDEDDDDVYCPLCGGEGVPLGTLGRRAHYRCRNCGIDFSSKHDA
jgi:hypothetical protein